MVVKNNKNFNRSIFRLLSVGTFLHFLFCLDIGLATKFGNASIIMLTITILFNIISVLFIRFNFNNFSSVKTNVILLVSFFNSIFGVALSLKLAGNPDGTFFYLLIMILAIMEINLVSEKRVKVGLYLIAFSFLIYGLFFTTPTIIFNSRTLFGFGLLFLWKSFNQIFYKHFMVDREQELKLETFHSTVDTLRNELNNTTHTILGFSELMEINSEKKDEYLVKVKSSLEKMSAQINKIELLDEVQYDNSYDGQNLINIK